MGDRNRKSHKGRNAGKEIAPQQPQPNSEATARFSWQLRVPTQIAVSGQQLAFNSMQTSLVDTAEKIDNLQKKVQELEREKSSLENELETKNKELAHLKRQVVDLESDKKKLQEEVKILKRQIEQHGNEIIALTAQVKNLQQENEEEKNQVAKLRADMSNTKNDLMETNRVNANLKARLTKMELQQGMNMPEQERTFESMAFIVFGEMCRQLQNKMYQEVFPEDFAENYNYTVKLLKEDIDEETDPERKVDVEERWNELKKRLGWQDKLIRTIASLKQDRNASAHPQVSEGEVRYFLDEMTRGKKLPVRGIGSAANVKMLVEMWASLIAQ